MAPTRHFKTLDEFNRGYAGPQTLLLEKKCRELAGKQDDFCLICGDDEAELFPQLGPKEIHLCPRRFCSKCYHIEADWKKKSSRFNNDIYRETEYVPLCCALCWKRGWDISNPLLGRDQPEWQTWTGEPMEEVLSRRYTHWEECAVSKEFAALFKWRLPLRHMSDDMTLESDRKVLKAIDNKYLKNLSRFNKFEKNAIWGSPPPSGPTFSVSRAFDDIVQRLVKLQPTALTRYEAAEQGVMDEVRTGAPYEADGLEGMGDEEERGTPESTRQLPEQPTPGRPQRQAAQFGFVKVNGVPVRQSRSTPQKSIGSGSPDSDQDMLDQQISHSLAIGPSTPHTGGSLSNDPILLPPSPSTQQDDATPGPSSIHNVMTPNEDFDNDETGDIIKAMIDHKYKQNRQLKEVKVYQAELLRVVNEQLEESKARAKQLEEERETSCTRESELRRQLTATRAANTALQHTIGGLKEEHERQLRTIAELNERIAQQAEQSMRLQHLQGEIEEHKHKYANLEADLEISKTREDELKSKIAGQCDALEALQELIEEAEEKTTKLKKENREFILGMAWREQELEELKNATGTMDRKSRAIHGLREDQDEVMEANKQLRKDMANIGAELAIERGLREVDGARMHQALVCGSLSSDLVDRLVQNPFLETQLAEKVKERALLDRPSSDLQHSPASGAKRRRTGPVVGLFD